MKSIPEIFEKIFPKIKLLMSKHPITLKIFPTIEEKKFS
jgi:hypothetical protein